MTGMSQPWITTLEQAREYVKRVKICTVFPGDKSDLPSLWDQVDLPEKQPGESGWGEKMSAVWTWKNGLPGEYPSEIFYGKIEGGVAALMDTDYLANTHFPQAYKHIDTLNELARHIYGLVAVEPWDTTSLRKATMKEAGCSKSQFDTALKNLQVTMNIARLNEEQYEHDTWVAFKEQYLDIWQRHVGDN